MRARRIPFWSIVIAALVYFNVSKAVDVYNSKGELKALEGLEKQYDAQIKHLSEQYKKSLRKTSYKYQKHEIKIRPKRQKYDSYLG